MSNSIIVANPINNEPYDKSKRAILSQGARWSAASVALPSLMLFSGEANAKPRDFSIKISSTAEFWYLGVPDGYHVYLVTNQQKTREFKGAVSVVAGKSNIYKYELANGLRDQCSFDEEHRRLSSGPRFAIPSRAYDVLYGVAARGARLVFYTEYDRESQRDINWAQVHVWFTNTNTWRMINLNLSIERNQKALVELEKIIDLSNNHFQQMVMSAGATAATAAASIYLRTQDFIPPSIVTGAAAFAAGSLAVLSWINFGKANIRLQAWNRVWLN